MKIKLILAIVFSFIFYKPTEAQTIDTIACRIVEQNLISIDQYLKNSKSFPSDIRQKAVAFLIELTGITSESDIDYFGQMFPTKNDIYYWRRWYNRNKVNLIFDKVKNSIIVHKEVLL